MTEPRLWIFGDGSAGPTEVIEHNDAVEALRTVLIYADGMIPPTSEREPTKAESAVFALATRCRVAEQQLERVTAERDRENKRYCVEHDHAERATSDGCPICTQRELEAALVQVSEETTKAGVQMERAIAAERERDTLREQVAGLEARIEDGRCCDDTDRLLDCGHPPCAMSEVCELCLEIADATDGMERERDTARGYVGALVAALEESMRLHHDAALEPCTCGDVTSESPCPACSLATRADEVTEAALSSIPAELRQAGVKP